MGSKFNFKKILENQKMKLMRSIFIMSLVVTFLSIDLQAVQERMTKVSCGGRGGSCGGSNAVTAEDIARYNDDIFRAKSESQDDKYQLDDETCHKNVANFFNREKRSCPSPNNYSSE